MRPVRAIGLMSGTSLDGVDVAPDRRREHCGIWAERLPSLFACGTRAIASALADAADLADRKARRGVIRGDSSRP